MNDDELRERLRAMPEPTATIDVDAVVADARRRRRPKVVGVGVAAGAACLAFLAPVVVPGLLGPDPVTASLESSSGGGAEEQSAPAGEAPSDDGADTTEQPSTLGTDESTEATIPAACTPLDSSALGDLLYLGFADDPADGRATLEIANRGDVDATLRIGEVGIALMGTSVTGVTGAAVLDPASSDAGIDVVVPAGGSTSIEVDVDTDVVACGDAEVDGVVAPIVMAAVDGQPLPAPVVGTLFQP